MEAAEAADQISEIAEGDGKHHDLRTQGALTIALLAMLLAITSVGGGNAMKEMINANISTSDAYAFYQAKNIRQTAIRVAAEEMELLMPVVPTGNQPAMQKRIDDYKATVARYESEPDPAAPNDPTKGEGKKELLARAQMWEERRERAQLQDPNFDFSEALFQISIVLGSVAIVSSKRPVLWLSWAMGVFATLLMVNGFFVIVHLPIG